MVSEIIEEAIKATETGLLTDIFIVLMLLVFLMACVSKKSDKFHAYTQYVPTLLTTLGIIGTFFGIVAGLLGFDVANIDGSIGALLAGMKTAFTTSLVGMCLSVFYKILVSFGLLAPKSALTVDEDQLGVVDLYTVMTEQRDGIRALTEAIGSGDESSLMGQIKLLRSDMNDSLKDSRREFEQFQDRLWIKLQDFADMLSKSATETVIEALNQVIRDFNQNLTEQFGENFKQLNEAVLKLVDWQENYKVQLEEMSAQYTQGVTVITDTGAAVANISENAGQIPKSMEHLTEVISVNQHQIDELGRHLQAFQDIKDKAVAAVPELDARIEQTLTGVDGATSKLAEGLAEVTAQVVSTINNGTEQFIDGVNKSNAALVESSQAVSKDSENIKTLLNDATLDINNSFRDMANNMDEHTKSVAENLKTSGDALVEEAARSRQSFESGLSTMRDDLASSLKQASEQQTQEMLRLIGSVETTMEGAVNKTSESVEKQVNLLDHSFRDMANNMDEHTKSVAENLKTSGDALVEEAARSRQSFESGLSTMRDDLAGSLRLASEQQAQEMLRLVGSVEKTMNDAINKTGESVQNQVIALDQAMEQEINNSMQQMGKQLAAITGQFTKDYKAMVSDMNEVIKAR